MIMGCVSYPLTEQIKDTVAAHGWHWAYTYYVKEQRIPKWMWSVLTDAAVKYLKPVPLWSGLPGASPWPFPPQLRGA